MRDEEATRAERKSDKDGGKKSQSENSAEVASERIGRGKDELSQIGRKSKKRVRGAQHRK